MPHNSRPIHLTSIPPTCSFEEASRAFAKVTEILIRVDARIKQQEASAMREQETERSRDQSGEDQASKGG